MVRRRRSRTRGVKRRNGLTVTADTGILTTLTLGQEEWTVAKATMDNGRDSTALDLNMKHTHKVSCSAGNLDARPVLVG